MIYLFSTQLKNQALRVAFSRDLSEANSRLSAEFAQEGETKLIRGEKDVQVLAYAFIDRSTRSYLYGLADERVPKN